MKLASTTTLLLVLKSSASVTSDQHLRVRQRTLTNTTDATNFTASPVSAPPTVSPAPTTNSTTVSPAPTTNSTTVSPSLSPTTTAPTESPTNETTAVPTDEPTQAPTTWECPGDELVPIGTWNDYWWNELPSCVQEAATVFDSNQNKWDNGIDSCPPFCDEWWKDLTSRQKWAARTFGYNKQRWNSGRERNEKRV
eukprot:scaffold4394_cov149-Skeletonema_menzelii.AAC.7